MKITAESYGHAVILNLKGELTEDGVSSLKEAVDHQLEDVEVVDIAFNLETVPFIDSAGLEYLLDLQDQLDERLGQVRLIQCDQNVRKILEITRLDNVFELFDNVSQTVRAVEP